MVDIVAKLRGPQGCPWDKEQTRESLKPYLIEEFYELIDALDGNDLEHVKEELGDLLFQIVLQSQLLKEEDQFDINDVIEGIAQKMVRRHPHVFGDKKCETSGDVVEWWEEHKKKEARNHESVLDNIPKSLPALLKAHKIQLEATKVGFDWEKIEDVVAKLEEEIREFKGALYKKDQTEIEDELGDIFFVLIRISNFVNINPEDALTKTINKFIRRFKHIEKQTLNQGKKLSDMSLSEMDILWNEAKEKST